MKKFWGLLVHLGTNTWENSHEYKRDESVMELTAMSGIKLWKTALKRELTQSFFLLAKGFVTNPIPSLPSKEAGLVKK